MREIGAGDFGSWKAQKVPGFQLSVDEDRLTEMLIRLHKRSLIFQGMGTIYDAKKTPRSDFAITPIETQTRRNYAGLISRIVKKLTGLS
jgi:hypothetical protein